MLFNILIKPYNTKDLIFWSDLVLKSFLKKHFFFFQLQEHQIFGFERMAFQIGFFFIFFFKCLKNVSNETFTQFFYCRNASFFGFGRTGFCKGIFFSFFFIFIVLKIFLMKHFFLFFYCRNAGFLDLDEPDLK